MAENRMQDTKVFQAIRTRRAVRSFAAEPVSDEDIKRIILAGRYSGSAKNRQPWQFIVVTEDDKLRALSECGPWCGHLAGAAFAVVMTVEDMYDPPTLTTPFDLGRASQNMILVAWELGVMSCMATIYDPIKARSALDIPEDRAVPWAISFGYPTPESDPRQRPPRKGGRKALNDIVHWEQW